MAGAEHRWSRERTEGKKKEPQGTPGARQEKEIEKEANCALLKGRASQGEQEMSRKCSDYNNGCLCTEAEGDQSKQCLLPGVLHLCIGR